MVGAEYTEKRPDLQRPPDVQEVSQWAALHWQRVTRGPVRSYVQAPWEEFLVVFGRVWDPETGTSFGGSNGLGTMVRAEEGRPRNVGSGAKARLLRLVWTAHG